jgi:Uma2 family endonuclease
MATATVNVQPSPSWGIARLRRHLGMIPAERILLFPYSRPATPEDVVYLDEHHNVICELFDGVLVRKPMGLEESIIAMFIGRMIGNFADKRKLGKLAGEAGFLELMPGQVRSSDVAFISKDRLPGGKVPKKKIPPLVPNLCVEVLSESNTPKEMARKRKECDVLPGFKLKVSKIFSD